jgi:pSer/pThr/pTyr-binding forkhead associated (FHA) protein
MNGPRLEWISRSNKLEVFKIPASIRIGRIPHYADIAVLAERVSKFHAEIRKVEGSHHIKDLDSVDGTYVNGNRIESQRLSSGDNIRISAAIEIQYREGPGSNVETETTIPRSDLDVCWINERRIIIGIYEGEASQILRFRLNQRVVEYDIKSILENYPNP